MIMMIGVNGEPEVDEWDARPIDSSDSLSLVDYDGYARLYDVGGSLVRPRGSCIGLILKSRLRGMSSFVS